MPQTFTEHSLRGEMAEPSASRREGAGKKIERENRNYFRPDFADCFHKNAHDEITTTKQIGKTATLFTHISYMGIPLQQRDRYAHENISTSSFTRQMGE